MTRLEELLYNLTAVIIRYHDKQSSKPLVVESDKGELRKKVHASAVDIIKSTKTDFKSRLDDLIKASTDESSSTRRHFLKYILHEIIFLKAQLDRKSSYEPEQLDELKKQLSQLFTDFKKLMTTPKSTTCTVHHSELAPKESPAIALSGLINTGYTGGEICNSGLYLNEEVLIPFSIYTNSSQKEINAVAEQISTELQNALLVSELTHKTQQLCTTNSEQQQSLKLLSTQNHELDTKLKEAQAKQKVLLGTILIEKSRAQKREEELSTINFDQKQVISELKQKIVDLSEQASLEELSDSENEGSKRTYGFFGSMI
ncbi:hypothetical protein [Legionella waltersii]|uniref:Uncharacterized protein n=1 Tax=Legionella waltersii TaxID=66969 RepID=A0A0W1A798_9GAMM|nr:hypothetical protein [Legionella waltersii]KTD77176.1 hypothetical protein Lwal_1953 [Legionella waltersii]SNV11341.1 Uncharacterised protein [Legionella waltersii]